MKKLLQTIKLKHLFKEEFREENRKYTMGYIVLFRNDTYTQVWNKNDLLALIEKDNSNKIRYIFDLTDRIILDRNIKVEDDIDGE